MNRPTWVFRYLSVALSTVLWMTIASAFPAGARSQDPGTSGSNPAAQAPSSSSSSQNTKKSGDSTSKDSDVSVDSSAPSSSTVNAIGTASPLDLPNGSLRWGDFYVSDVSYTEIYDHSNYFDQSSSTLTGIGVSNSTSLFQTTLAFNHLSRKNQIAVQYQPRLAIINGNVYTDYSNQNVSFDWYVAQNARWSLNFHDTFTYFSSQNLYASFYTDANSQTGTTIQKNFLDGPGTLLNEAAGLSISYRWTPRMTVSFAPGFSYMRTTGSQLGTLISRNYGGAVTLGYQLSPRQTIAGYFSSQYIVISGFSANSKLYTTGMSYSRQVGPSWMVSGSLGATRTPGAGISDPWTFTGTASVTRGFQLGQAGLVYSRDVAMGYVTNQIADRIDARTSWRLVRNLELSVSGGYQRESRVSNPISAYYTVNQLDWRLAPRVSAFVNYGYRMQNGDAIRVLLGHRNFVSGGIRWASSPVESH